MKATDLTIPGFYWCSHDLNRWPPGEETQRGWRVVEFVSPREIWPTIGEDSVQACQIPADVMFEGPLPPPVPLDT
jgi:hypothetical protein